MSSSSSLSAASSSLDSLRSPYEERQATEEELIEAAPAHVRHLLRFYQSKIRSFENERHDLIEKIKSFDGKKEFRGRLDLVLGQRDHEIRELQDALSASHILLYDHREQIQAVVKENEDLRLQQLQDRRRIQHLLALAEPVDQDVTYFRDAPPDKMTRPYAGTRPIVDDGSGRRRSRTTKQQQQKQNVLRTIFLPHENVELLKSIIDSLRKQLSDQKKLYEDRYQALLEDREIRIEQEKDRDRKRDESLALLRQQVREVNEVCQSTTLDYFNLRHKTGRQIQEQQEEIARLEQERVATQRALRTAKQEASHGHKQLHERASQRERDLVETFHEQQLNKEEEIAMLREQLAASQAMYRKRLQKTEDDSERWKSKFVALERRRNLEFEGYTRDIRGIRDGMASLERVLSKFHVLKGAKEQEDVVRALKKLQHNVKRVASRSYGTHEIENEQPPCTVDSHKHVLSHQ